MCSIQEPPCEKCPGPKFECGNPAPTAGMPDPCAPEKPRQCVFGRETCGRCSLSYVQPPRPQSFKPISIYCRPTVPVECETVYKKSFFPMDANIMQNARSAPIIRKDNIEKIYAKPEDKSVMRLSYMGHCGVKPPAPIIPSRRKLMDLGPLCPETTQRHDFVPKPTMRVGPILPEDNILKTCAPFEKNTTFRLSYMPVDISQNPPPKPIVPPGENYKTSLPAESDTIYKLSYPPVCPPAKEDMPWARKVSHSNPCAPIEKNTIYKLSYPGNCGQKKLDPIHPVSCLKLFDGVPAKCTVYKASYMPACTERPCPIIPTPNITRINAPVEKDTVYKLSYMAHCDPKPPSAIVPAPSRLRNCGPVATTTTQKMSYVPLPMCRTAPIVPVDNTVVPRDPMEKNTVYRLSYIPTDMGNYQRTQPIRPITMTTKSTMPMEHETTHSLSYMPVCPPKREPTPWATRGAYEPPTAPAECATIQRMSYRPPGSFSDGCTSCCCYSAQQNQFENHTFPKAGIVS